MPIYPCNARSQFAKQPLVLIINHSLIDVCQLHIAIIATIAAPIKAPAALTPRPEAAFVWVGVAVAEALVGDATAAATSVAVWVAVETTPLKVDVTVLVVNPV